MCLGRNGDLISILPAMWALAQTGVRPVVCVSEEFSGVMDGVSYCDHIVYPGPYNDPAAGNRWLQNHLRGQEITIAQWYRHPFDHSRQTSSYQTESWRVAGMLNEFGKHPLVFDKRDLDREKTLTDTVDSQGKDLILVALDGVSSPLRQREEIIEMIHQSFPDACICDISKIRGHRVYDLISLYEKSDCIISCDTVHLHLSRAARVPVVALINNGFFGSVPPPNAVATIRYSDADMIEKVRHAVTTVLDAKNGHHFVVHAVHMHGDSERHRKAQATWPAAYGTESIIKHHSTDWGLTMKIPDDPRELPPLKVILEGPRDKTISDSDVIIFQNSDIALSSGSIEQMRRHAATFGAFSMRRVEPGSGYTHIGRDLFGFRADWLRENLAKIPDFFIGCPYFDLVIAAMIRKERGIVSTKENLSPDFYPCEMASGMATHEAHKSSWDGENEFKFGANLHNRKLALEWCREEMPSLEL